MSLVLICTSVLLCVCMWVGGWLNVPVEFLFQNRISSGKRVYNARNVTTSIVIINLLKLIINSISALQVHCAEIWSFCHVKKRKGKEKKFDFYFDQMQSRTESMVQGFQFLFDLPALCSIAALSPSLTQPFERPN